MEFPRLPLAVLIALPHLLGQTLDAILVLETTPGTEQAIGLLDPRAFQDSDRAGVIVFQRASQVLQPLTADRNEFAATLHRAGMRMGVGDYRALINSSLPVDLGGALKKAVAAFGQPASSGHQRAILVLFAGEDPGLSASLSSLKVSLRAAGIRLFAVQVQRVDPRGAVLPPGAGGYPTRALTAELVSQLAKDSGGRLFRRNWNLEEILRLARKP